MYWCTSSSYYLTRRWGGRVAKLRKKNELKNFLKNLNYEEWRFTRIFLFRNELKEKCDGCQMWVVGASVLGLRWIFNRVPQKNLIKVSSLDIWSWTARMSLQETNQQPSKTATKTICLSPPHTKHLRTCSENFLIKK